MDASLTNAILTPIVQTLAAAVFAGLLALIPRALSLIKDAHIRQFVTTQVFSVEQTAAEALSGPAKKQLVLALAQKRFPGVPVAVLQGVLEAAVHTLPSNIARIQSTENAIADGLRQAISESAAPASSGPPVARTAPFGVTAAGGPVPPAGTGTTAP